MATPSTKRAALVTGAASGIGRAAALALARAGYHVAINYSKSEKEAKAVAEEAGRSGARTLLCRCDVADEAGVRAMLTTVGDEFGRLDVLINNAGTTAAWKPKDLESLSLEDWDRVFAVNVRGLFQVTRAAVPLLRVSEGCIVNTASIVGLRPGPQPLPYAASKAAVINLTKTLAYNLGPEIRVNAVAPGWMEGDWMQRMLKDKYEEGMGLDSIDILEVALAVSKAYGVKLRSDDELNRKIFNSLRSLNEHIQQHRVK